MLASIKQGLAPPVFEGDEEKTYRARLLNTMLNLGIITVGLTLVGNFLDSSTPLRNFVIDFCIIAVFLFLRHLLFTGRVQLVAYFTITATFVFQAISIASEGTTLAPTTALFSLLVIIAGFFFNLAGIVVATITSSLVVAGLILARHAGLLPPSNYAESTFQWFVFTITFGVTGGLAYFSQQLTKKALKLAEDEITERKRAEAELRKLTRAVEQSPASVVITDLSGNIEYVNPRFTQVTGYSSAEALGNNPRILKTDLTPPGIYQQLWETITQGQEWRGEFVNHKKDGSLYYESASISPITDLSGIATHYLAVKEDITERKQVEEALLTSEKRFRSLFEQNHDAVFIIGLDWSYLDANQRAADMFGYSVDEIKQLAGRDVFAGPSQSENTFGRLVDGEEIPIIEKLFRKKNGQIIPVEINVQLIKDKNGNPVHIQSVVRDISLRKQAEEKLKTLNVQLRLRVAEVETLQQELLEQAIHDPLTGLYNRRYLSETIEREIVRAKRENDVFSIIISDIDHFKMINDTYGHQIGDKFLVAVASLQEKHTRGSDIACRYGGEEFLLLLPGIKLDFAVQRAEEIRQKCAEFSLQHEGKDLSVTMSFGVASYPDHGQEADEIIIKADKAMYQSKHSGRNKVTAWADTTSFC